MSKIFDNLWILAIGVLSWVAQRLTAKIDSLESNKADNDALNQQRSDLKDLDKRVDAIDHSTQLKLVPRNEIKGDLINLHSRINELERQKSDRIKTIRIDKDKGK
tara:strand:+ start:153 stop:467 length:315 start_codon:yes stop_codon:yes gene_type:complete